MCCSNIIDSLSATCTWALTYCIQYYYWLLWLTCPQILNRQRTHTGSAIFRILIQRAGHMAISHMIFELMIIWRKMVPHKQTTDFCLYRYLWNTIYSRKQKWTDGESNSVSKIRYVKLSMLSTCHYKDHIWTRFVYIMNVFNIYCISKRWLNDILPVLMNLFHLQIMGYFSQSFISLHNSFKGKNS